MNEKRFFLVGGAGFIGSHFVDRLLADPSVEAVTIYDNLSSGRQWHYRHHQQDSRFRVVIGDVRDFNRLQDSMRDHDVVFHLASNPDIARAVTEPTIDFDNGTYLTHLVVEAMRITRTKRILYASGSGVYGDLGDLKAHEDLGPLIPISTYGASKLAGEVLIAAYSHMFDITGCVFRFANVVGPRQTHGVGLDFLRRLLSNPGRLRLLGNGMQSKSYIHVQDVVDAVLLANSAKLSKFEVYNVATADYITVNEIAEVVLDSLGLNPLEVRLEFTGGDRGWKGDVPIVRLSTRRIRCLGWSPKMTSREALQESILSLREELRSGLLQEKETAHDGCNSTSFQFTQGCVS